MVATFRCEELRSQAFGEVQIDVAELKKEAQKGEVNNICEKLSKIFKVAIDTYSTTAGRYEESVFNKKKMELFECLISVTQKHVEYHLSHFVRRVCVCVSDDTKKQIIDRKRRRGDKDWSGTLTLNALNDLEKWGTFEADGINWLNAHLSKYDLEAASVCECVCVCVNDPSVHSFEVSSVRRTLEVSLENTLRSSRESELYMFEKCALPEYVDGCLERVRVCLKQQQISPAEFWDISKECLSHAHTHTSDRFKLAAKGLGVHDLDGTSSRVCLGRYVCLLGSTKDTLHQRAFDVFNIKFSSDDKGVPRHWPDMTSEAIQKSFLTARNDALEVLSIFDKYNLGDSLSPSGEAEEEIKKILSEPLMSENEKQIATEKAVALMDRACRDALLVQSSGGAGTKIPLWFWFVLVFLGWNEFIYVVSNPLFFVCVLGVVAVAIVAYYTGRADILMNISRQTLSMFTTILVPLLHTVHTQLQPLGTKKLETNSKT
eukprot:GHVR01042415.1.p1 GENE.GHVR01042415.1~~GHVR01042415.1.p1  ORF type:complete len:488 (+),score=127.71 GHVR01042415.1:927-2390(+)